MKRRAVGFVATTPVSFSSGNVKFIDSRQRPNPVRTRRRESKQSIHRHVAPSARVRRGFKPDPVIPDSLYDAESLPDVDFEPFDFSTLRDRVVLVVNVASTDQFTETNYKSFVDLLEKYHAGGFEIVVFPCNWFGQYEGGSHEEIKAFVHENYSDKIKVMAKTDLEWNPIFALGKKYFPGQIIWNFHGKFLFGRKGLPVARFDLLSTHEFIENQVSLYVNNTDEALHTPTLPDPSLYEDEDEIMFVSSEREGNESSKEVDSVAKDDNEDEDEDGDEDVDDDVADEIPHGVEEQSSDAEIDSSAGEPVSSTAKSVDEGG